MTEIMNRPVSHFPERKFPIVTELDESDLLTGISGFEAIATGLPVLLADDWYEIRNPLRRCHLPERFVSGLRLGDRFVRDGLPPYDLCLVEWAERTPGWAELRRAADERYDFAHRVK